MSNAKQIVKGSFWNITSGLLTKAISFIYTIIIARLVIPEEVGIFYYVLSILGVLYIFTDLGILYSLSRYVPYFYGRGEFSKLKKLVKLSYFGGGGLTLIFSGIVFSLSFFISDILGRAEVAPILQMMAIWLFLREVDGVSRGILIGRKDMLRARSLEVLQNLSKLIITLIALFSIGFDANTLSISFIASYILVLPFGIYFARSESKKWKSDNSKEKIEIISFSKEIISFGIVVTIINTLWSIIQYVDRLMIGYFDPESLTQVAIYSIAVGLANLILIFPSSISGIFFPVISELFGKGDKKEMKKTTDIAMKWTIMALFPVGIIMGIFGAEILDIFYSNVYSSGAVVLGIFVFGLFVKSIFLIPQLILASIRRLDVELKAAGIAAISNVVLNYLLIPEFGINGAAIASALSFIIMSLAIWFYSSKIFGFKFSKNFVKPLVGGLITLIILFLVKDYVILGLDSYVLNIQIGESQGQLADEVLQKIVKLAVFGILFLITSIIYLATLVLSKSFEKQEEEIVESVFRKAKIPKEYFEMVKRVIFR